VEIATIKAATAEGFLFPEAVICSFTWAGSHHLDVTYNSYYAGHRIERDLGRGGMATVYLAHDLHHKRQVALKLLDPEIGALLGIDRFLREIETAAQLQHPHILPVFDSGEVAGQPWYTMPYVAGETLRVCCDGRGASQSPMVCGSAARSPRRWTPRTSTASCTGTSNPKTSRSARMGPDWRRGRPSYPVGAGRGPEGRGHFAAAPAPTAT